MIGEFLGLGTLFGNNEKNFIAFVMIIVLSINFVYTNGTPFFSSKRVLAELYRVLNGICGRTT